MPTRFHGVIVPMVTPFREDLSLDLDAVRWLARFLAKNGVHGLFPISTTGEFVHLNRDEMVAIVRTIVEEVGGKVWVIPGITANATDQCIELGKAFMDLGIDGVIAAPPYYFKLPPKLLKKHFASIAGKLGIPMIIYNVPSLTGVNVPIELMVELAKEFSNVVGIKVTFDSFTYLRRLVKEVKSIRKDFAVLTGLDDMLLPTLELGGDGGIMGLANVAPWIHREVYDAWIEKDTRRAYEAYQKLLKLVEIYDLGRSFPSIVKAALHVCGTPIKPLVRPPLEPEPIETMEKVKKILEELGVCEKIRSSNP